MQLVAALLLTALSIIMARKAFVKLDHLNRCFGAEDDWPVSVSAGTEVRDAGLGSESDSNRQLGK